MKVTFMTITNETEVLHNVQTLNMQVTEIRPSKFSNKVKTEKFWRIHRYATSPSKDVLYDPNCYIPVLIESEDD